MKHIIFYSGGIGSWATAKRVIEKHGNENVILLFTDTLIEDYDLYRFLDETAKEMDVELVKIADGRTPWEVFKDVNFLGNSRIAHCSHILKQKIAEEWVVDNFNHDECILYLGIDWTESHRRKAPKENYHPYKVKFPMCREPYVSKEEMLLELDKIGIKRPRLYEMGFQHNNCGGFCVRAGFGHFARLHEKLPDYYKRCEEYEQEVIKHIGKKVSILRRSKVVKKYNPNGTMYKDTETSLVTLKEYRMELESKNVEVDYNDIGGCGCFVTNI